MLGVVPSLVKAWRKRDALAERDWSAIKVFSSTGECSNSSDMLFLMASAGYKPVIEYCGGTELGGAYLTATVVQPNAPATFSTPALGCDLVILDEDGTVADEGQAFLVPPSIGMSVALVNQDHQQVYFEGVPKGPKGVLLRRHGDRIGRLPGGYYRALGRADDTMNLGGIKVASAEIERILKGLEIVDETAAIAVTPTQGGPDKLVIYAVVLQEIAADSLTELLQAAIRKQLNPLFKIEETVIVPALPRTASGKVLRRALRHDYMQERVRTDEQSSGTES
jgi:acetyl-CoA synthetase